MIFKCLSKNKKILLLALVIFSLIAGVFLSIHSSAIFQEGNPWPQIKGMAQLSFGYKDVVKLSGSDNRYMTKGKNDQNAIMDFMKERDYEFTEQLGSGFIFKSSAGKNIVIVRRQYGRYYYLWNIPEEIK